MRERATVYRWKRGPSGPRKAAASKRAFSPGPSLARHEVRAAQSLNQARSGPRASLQTCPPKPCHPPPGGTDDPVGALRSSHLKFQISDFRSPLLRSPFRRSRLYFWFTFLARAPSRATVLPHPFSRGAAIVISPARSSPAARQARRSAGAAHAKSSESRRDG